MSERKFAVFILSHGRANSVYSYDSLLKHGYTGNIYVVIDNEDRQADLYRQKYGGKVIEFDKTRYAKNVDACDNFDKRNSVVYARNYCFKIAKEMGITHFLQLDDDYTRYQWSLDSQGKYQTSKNSITCLDDVFSSCLDLLDRTDFISVAFAQDGDFIGGDIGAQIMRLHKKQSIYRKAMNSFFFKSNSDVVFRGRVNDDVNLYVECGRRGQLFATIPNVRLSQPLTQVNSGGCTDIYKEMGTYVKSFYSVMVAPSCVKIAAIGVANRRIHHRVIWKHACPMIISEKHRKPR